MKNELRILIDFNENKPKRQPTNSPNQNHVLYIIYLEIKASSSTVSQSVWKEAGMLKSHSI